MNLKSNVNCHLKKISQEGTPPNHANNIHHQSSPNWTQKESGKCEEKKEVRENWYLPKLSCYLQTLIETMYLSGTEKS